MLKKTFLGLVAVVALLAAACGDDKPTRNATSSTTSPTTSTTLFTTTTGAGVVGATTTARAGSSGATTTVAAGSGQATTTAPSGGSRTTTSLPQAYKSTATVSKKCANPGSTQTLTVKTLPDAIVAYNTVYSDGDSHGDNAGGVANSDGTYTDSYTVDLQAPKGQATITATSQHNQKGVSFAQTTFTVGC